MTQTTSLNLSKKLAALNLGVESDFCWAKLFRHQFYKEDIIDEEYRILYKLRHDGYAGINSFYRAYTLQELLPVLKALSKRNGWSEREITINVPAQTVRRVSRKGTVEVEWPAHQRTRIVKSKRWEKEWLKICSLYAQSESLEGVEKYIEELIK